ncbi:hypothetical protein FO440_17045 [Mucilaginibacter corticis]|uniref:Uncharacterized protein n=1 Tax=Mucilaginibacter corticis TaxID=2597670 RepID=A0A556MHR0_9SPHI|nr:hypothetical protein [Mucilaginibacter corticis]TSJ39450.1 hypothetical protein FO440_17045 [Mucilaginibacter corticis]
MNFISNFFSSNQFFLLIIVILVIGCKPKSNDIDNRIELSQLLDPSPNNNWGGDVILKIVDKKHTPNNETYTLKALYNKDTVGLALSIPNKATNKDGFSTGMKITSIGKVSNNFLHALTSIYKLKTDSANLFIREVDAEYVDLEKFVISTGNKPTDNDGFTKYKLFFDVNNDDEAEVFLNINENEKLVQLMEKDEEYRMPLIVALTNQTPISK